MIQGSTSRSKSPHARHKIRGAACNFAAGKRTAISAWIVAPQVAQIAVDFPTVDDLAEDSVELPITVNVVSGDQARNRVPNPVVEVERLLADSVEAKKSANQALREDDPRAAEANLDGILGNITHMRESLVERGRPDLLPRLDQVEEDLNGLKDSVVREDAVFAMKMKTDSLNSSYRGRNAAASRKNTASNNSPKDSRDLKHNDNVDSALSVILMSS